MIEVRAMETIDTEIEQLASVLATETKLAMLRDYCMSLDGADKKIVDLIYYGKVAE